MTPMLTGWEVNELNGLRREANQSMQQTQARVARQVEGLFLHMVMKSMRATLPGSDLLASDAQRMFTSLYDQQLTQGSIDTHLGLAQLIERQMQAVPPATPNTGQRSYPLDSERRFYPSVKSRGVPSLNAINSLAPPMRKFVQQLLPHVQQVSRTTGISPLLILAQAALESAWGQRQIMTEQGKPSHNLFGIKAGGNWQGPTTHTRTTEYQQGQPQKTTAPFRVYGSWQQALRDYGELLSTPRYRAVSRAGNAEQGAYALQQAGYATDPHYARKLVAIIRQLMPHPSSQLPLSTLNFDELF